MQWEAKSPTPSLCFKSLVKQIVKLHNNLVDILPHQQLEVSHSRMSERERERGGERERERKKEGGREGGKGKDMGICLWVQHMYLYTCSLKPHMCISCYNFLPEITKS